MKNRSVPLRPSCPLCEIFLWLIASASPSGAKTCTNALVAKIYPDGMHHCIADGLREDATFDVQTATLQEAEHGLTKSVLAHTDVLLWWGHAAQVADAVVERVLGRVWEGWASLPSTRRITRKSSSA
jgi:hypothetical protein